MSSFRQLTRQVVHVVFNAAYVRQIIKALISQGYLRMTDGEFPILVLTETSGEILYKRIPVTMRYPADMQIESGAAKKEKREVPVGRKSISAGSADPALYKVLSDLRMELATVQNVPAFYIFSNATLEDMCRKCPRTLEELLEVSGVGRAKLDRYGEIFLERIADYLDRREEEI